MATAAYYESYVDFVIFKGLTEKYPSWFTDEVLDDLVMDASRYTIWFPNGERPTDYYEKVVVETDSVFLRKPNGTIHMVEYPIFKEMYHTFVYNDFISSGVAAFMEDTIEYVECLPGVLSEEYPDWFYEYFTEVANLPDEETILWNNSFDVYTETKGLYLGTEGDITVQDHCVFVRNVAGSIMYVSWENFVRDFNPGPGQYEFEDLDGSMDISVSQRWNYGVREI